MILLHGYIGAYYFRDFFYPDTEDIPIDELVCISCDWTIYFGYSFLFIVITTLASISIFSEKRSAAAVLEVQKLKALQSESELQSLKNQINPHFLFNALSSIYSISYLGDKRAPDKIMQLSKMMRYVLYECNQNFVLLSNEIEYLESYIDFQKIKVEHNQSIVFDTKILNSKTQIAPMILLPLLENAFKHSAIQRVKTAYINISLNSDEKGDIHFVIKNSVPISQSQIVVDDIGGIGIENLRKRLNILYKNKYELSLLDDGTSFEVKLFLKQPKGK
jgi:LytS/YehU family sensor histidine kinase